MYTQEQLTTMSDYEINCAVAEKLGLEVIIETNQAAKNMQFCKSSVWVLLFKGDNNYERYDHFSFCNDPRDYMPISIDNSITIDYVHDDGTVCAIWTKPEAVLINHDKDDYISSKDMHKNKTGRAVCEAYLMMDKAP